MFTLIQYEQVRSVTQLTIMKGNSALKKIGANSSSNSDLDFYQIFRKMKWEKDKPIRSTQETEENVK